MAARKLYYEDCHLREFTARVETCTEEAGFWAVTLDATAFYPEGGGQACDLGTLDGVKVLDVRERGEEVVHFCDGPLSVGSTVRGTVDWARRFDLMQQHSGEHILSGLIHARYGYHNIGFHMGEDLVTIDFDGPIEPEVLETLERQANEAVWRNMPIRCWYPTAEELPSIPYRSKKALPWPVRIVEVPGIDLCACCGVHVGQTGEIGLIKIFSCIRFKQGVRMEIACGARAYSRMVQLFEQNRQVSQAFSAKPEATGEAARRMNEILAAEKFRASGLQARIFDALAASLAGKGSVLHFEDGLDSGSVRQLADKIGAVCGGTAAVFSGSDEAGYAFCLISREGDLRELGKKLNAELSGRGGGKTAFWQGSVRANRQTIEDFFVKNIE